MEGVGSLISIVTVTFTAPPLLFAQIVYTVEVEFTLGVPETSPVNGSSSSPAGNAGSTCHVATCPPVFAIVIPSTDIPSPDSTGGCGGKLASGSLIVGVSVTLTDPPELFPKIVKVVAVRFVVGVP